ncbi:hypothetical protein SAMN04515692_10535 [Leifsonia sp. CL147]|nr:hypothetical protein SAMN04515694_10536 [Leifsonia sp. CL154]SFL46729.1 hypothetical protein SAMN04515692_10535 [Leifsonia sp. CL147]
MDLQAATAVVTTFMGVIAICAGARAGLELLRRG